MKIVGVDNHARESVADILVAENVQNERYAKVMVDALNKEFGPRGDEIGTWYLLYPDDHRLSRGMEDLV